MGIHISRTAILTLSALVALGLGGCANDEPSSVPTTAAGTSDAAVESSSAVESAPAAESASDESSADPTESSGDYAFGAERDDMAVAIETAFESDNAAARWEGNVLILAIDGDAEADMAGFMQCRVVTQLINEDDEAVVEFPNGSLPCTKVLADD